MIQDYVLTLCSVIFGISQIGQIRYAHEHKRAGVNLGSASLFAASVWLMAVTYLSMGLYISGSTVLISAILWSTLLAQRIKYGC